MNPKDALKNIRIILVRAENPINIGQVARAMKNFGLSKLALVRSVFHRVPEAYTPGWKGKSILDGARVSASLKRAVSSSDLVIGFTTRSGRRRGKVRLWMDALPRVLETIKTGQVSLVFGNEKNGLSNEELGLCHEAVMIPAAKDYTSLNLSHAVAVVASAIFCQIEQSTPRIARHAYYQISQKEFEKLMMDFKTVLKMLNYKTSQRDHRLNLTLVSLRQFFQKAGIERRELHLFEAFLARVRERCNKIDDVKKNNEPSHRGFSKPIR